MLQPIGEHTLLPFLIQLLLLLVVARVLGELMRKIGQPAVVGELGAGLLLGPSVFARVTPDIAAFVFPGGDVSGTLIMGVAQLGVLLLLVVTGFETDLQLLRRLGRTSVTTSAASLLLPLAGGFAVGYVLPPGFVGDGSSRLIFALFVAVAVSISALAISGRILIELDLMRRDVGQLIVGVAMANELVGWVMLGLLTGIVLNGGLHVVELLVTVGSLVAFLVAALTLGQRLVDRSLRWLLAGGTGTGGAVTANIVLALVAAVITQAIGVEAALGAFVAGIVLGRSPYQREESRHTIETVANSFLAPIFFATSGIFVDVGSIMTPRRLFWFAVLLAVAVGTKFVGAYLGTRMGGRDHRTAIAMGVGLNARGTLEIVLATIALSLGVFNGVSYSTVVLVAMASALITPPLLRAALRRVTPHEQEAARLEREEVLATSVIANVERALVPTRGGQNSQLAAQALDLVLKPDAAVTVLSVHPPDHPEEDCRCQEALDAATAVFDDRSVERRRTVSNDPAEAVLKEIGLGYGLLALGMTEGFSSTNALSATLRKLLAATEVPLLLVRHGTRDDRMPADYRRLIVPVVGTRTGRAAEEVAYTLSARTGAGLDLIHVVTRPDRGASEIETDDRRGLLTRTFGFGRGDSVATAAPDSSAVSSLLNKALARAERFGVTADGHTLHGVTPYEGVQQIADERDADAIVMTAQVRSVEGEPFLGHGTEYLLEHAPQTVMVIVFPADEQER